MMLCSPDKKLESTFYFWINVWKTYFLFHKYSRVKTGYTLAICWVNHLWNQQFFCNKPGWLMLKSGGKHLKTYVQLPKHKVVCAEEVICHWHRKKLLQQIANKTNQTFKMKLIKYMAFSLLVVCYENRPALESVDKALLWHYIAKVHHVSNLVVIRPGLTSQHFYFPHCKSMQSNYGTP